MPLGIVPLIAVSAMLPAEARHGTALPKGQRLHTAHHLSIILRVVKRRMAHHLVIAARQSRRCMANSRMVCPVTLRNCVEQYVGE